MNPLLAVRPSHRRRGLTAVAVAVAAAGLGALMFGGGAVDRPGRPGSDLGEQLGGLRGANDLVRASRVDAGRDPALYPTAYGRLEATLVTGHPSKPPVPEIRPTALAGLVRTDLLDTPAWRAHYVCLALAGAKASVSPEAAAVLERAGVRQRAEEEALAYLRRPDQEDDKATSLATRAAFLHTLTCLGRAGKVPADARDRLAADAARIAEPVPVLYAVDALRAVGVRVRPTRALRDAEGHLRDDCAGLDPLQRAALALLRGRPTERTRSCLLPALGESDPQTRWVVRRALLLADPAGSSPARLPAPVSSIRPDGLVAKSPAQLGSLTATYDAARALTADAQRDKAPDWLKRRLTQLASDPALDPSDRIPLAMTCHRLGLACGPQADKGVKEAAGLTAPTRLTTENQRRWYGVMAARAEFGWGCLRTSVALPEEKGTALSPRSLRIVAVLAEAGCEAHVRRLTEGTDLVAQARRALRDGDLPTASDAVQAALVSDQSVPQSLWKDLPGLLEPYRDGTYPDLYAASPGGAASAEATRAAYYLLA
ncbi:hypothetical protein AB0K80_14145 [Streptomyces sp. NPDC052682]|uniref:hypothetical protein n=1 Tax=Streptomyces sp. NPDC052682 TaxID=3154954 RepID=UPI0034492BD6